MRPAWREAHTMRKARRPMGRFSWSADFDCRDGSGAAWRSRDDAGNRHRVSRRRRACKGHGANFVARLHHGRRQGRCCGFVERAARLRWFLRGRPRAKQGVQPAGVCKAVG